MQHRRPHSFKSKEGARINRDIRAREVRVIDQDGNMLGVLSVLEGIKQAESAGLDLVEVSPKAEPPVCKIIDYGKYLYQLEKKKKEAKKKQKTIQLKEIKLRPKTDVHDYKFKLKHIREFLTAGDRVKVTVRFRGREMAFMDVGKEQLDKVITDTSDLGKVYLQPKFEGRNLNMTITPIKK